MFIPVMIEKDTGENLENSSLGIGEHPYLTDPESFVSATVKAFDEDFVVTEIPLYVASGEGDHVYFCVEKQGITTNSAVVKIADKLGVKPYDIGVAGQKDKRALTRQMMSVEHVPPERVRDLDIPGIEIVSVDRHRNKLRTGHLAGNKFVIKLRNTNALDIETARGILSDLERSGVPNYYGIQRFGNRGDTWQVGCALISGDYRGALEIILGRSSGDDDPTDPARALFDWGDYQGAADAWPRGFGENAKLCRTFQRLDGHFKKTILSMPKKTLTFFVSAYQSHLFNRVLAERIAKNELGLLKAGDLAWKHENGACFIVDDPETDSSRAKAGEISPSGPMYGKKMKWPELEAGRFERGLLDSQGVTVDDFSKPGPFKCAGGRRPMRFFPAGCSAEPGTDGHGEYIQVSFALPAGCYATVLLRELCKDGLNLL